MIVLHIDKTNDSDAEKIDKHIKDGKDVFILVYMVGCGPCNATRPEWKKIENTLKDQYADNDNIVVIDIDKDLADRVKNIGSIEGYPTMKYIGENGDKIENYEDSNIKDKNRSIDSFVNWIESKALKNKVYSAGYRYHDKYSPESLYERLTRIGHNNVQKTKKTKSKYTKKKNKTRTKRVYSGGKWSRKYKRRINCNRPRGFSQKQYCKYGRKK